MNNWVAEADAKRLPLASKSVHCVVTSPPFWGLRKYPEPDSIGHEPTLAEHVANIVQVFRELRRVLRDDGTVWMEYGDSWNSTGNLQLLPFRVAMALQDDGWHLRSVCIWHKPNAMPESVKNRPTVAHSYVFLLTKRPTGYFYDLEAERVDSSWDGSCGRRNYRAWSPRGREDLGQGRTPHPNGASLRTVWAIPTQPLPFEHYASFPEELARRCISLGTSARGVCPACGKQWVRVTDGKVPTASLSPKYFGKVRHDRNRYGFKGERPRTLGWTASCTCDMDTPVPATVLDPFVGSGTTVAVAKAMGRRGIGLDIADDYCRIAKVRRCKMRTERPKDDGQMTLLEVADGNRH